MKSAKKTRSLSKTREMLDKAMRIPLLLLIVALFIWSIFKSTQSVLPYLERRWIQYQLSISENKWRSQKISNYNIDVQIIENPGCNANVTLVVRDDQLTSVVVKDGTKIPTSCMFAKYLIPEMFDVVKNNLTIKAKTSISMKFDSRFGYISYFDFHILPDKISTYEDYFIITYTNFEKIVSP